MDTSIPTDLPTTTDVLIGHTGVTDRPSRTVTKATHRALLKENRALRKTVDFLALALCGITRCEFRGDEQEYYAYVARHIPEGSGIRETLRRRLILRNCLLGDPGEDFTYRQYMDSTKPVGRFVQKVQEWCDANPEGDV